MTKAAKTLLKFFNEMNHRQRKNLKWHAEQKTPIACGDRSARGDAKGEGLTR